MDHLVRLSDLFVIGLGLDLAGACLVARGLVSSNETIRIASGTYLGLNGKLVVERVKDKAAAYFGLGALIVGFSIQGVAYVIGVARDSTSNTGDLGAAIFAGAAGVVAAAIVLVVYRLLRREVERHLLVEISRWDSKGIRRDRPLAGILVLYGPHWTGKPAEGDSAVEYAKQVFRVDASDEPID